MSGLEQIIRTLKSITYIPITGSWAEKQFDECGGELLLLSGLSGLHF